MSPNRFCGTCFALLVAGCTGSSPSSVPVRTPPKTIASAPVQMSKPEPVVCAVASGLPPLVSKTVANQSTEVSGDNLRNAVESLADVSLHGRAAGSPDNRRVANWIAKRFASYGLSAPNQNDYCVPFERSGIRDQNVVAHLRRNTMPNAPVVLVGAHYDAQGEKDGAVKPGADDNASGVAALLEIARLSAKRTTGPDMIFVAFGAEEVGLFGAKAYVESPSMPLSQISLMINLDMVGRPMLDGSPLRLLIWHADETLGYIVGDRDKPATQMMLDRAAEREERPIVGIPEAVLTRLGFGSDSVPFSPHVPTIFLSTGDHADYHQPTDTADKINVEQMTRAARLTLAIIDEIKPK